MRHRPDYGVISAVPIRSRLDWASCWYKLQKGKLLVGARWDSFNKRRPEVSHPNGCVADDLRAI
eukprot:1334284-Karenia_brevis.AAC.1